MEGFSLPACFFADQLEAILNCSSGTAAAGPADVIVSVDG